MTSENFNKLTPAETERLAMLAEEAAEIIQIVGKILRHGYDSYNPNNEKITNRDLLNQEIVDLMAVSEAMVNNNDILDQYSNDIYRAWQRKLKWSHHQEKTDA
jgi:hypothetical protein